MSAISYIVVRFKVDNNRSWVPVLYACNSIAGNEKSLAVRKKVCNFAADFKYSKKE